MRALPIIAAAGAVWALLTSATWPQAAEELPATPAEAVMVAPPPPPPPPPPPTVQEALERGTVIVVSKASQQMHVFRDGVHWRSTPVSTGRRGKATPAGVFPILQKKVFHRSNLYSNAPMPYMQRLTWSGIAIHAGHLPGYPASHGCIRVPREFARALYGVTRHTNTAVLVTNEAVRTEKAAHLLASNTVLPNEREIRLARAEAGLGRPVGPPRMAYPAYPAIAPQAVAPVAAVPAIVLASAPRGSQTIQLVAAPSAQEAAAHWAGLLRQRPDLATMRQTIVPAVVGARQVYRLRVSAPGAHAMCGNLKRSGIDCFNVA